MLDLIGHALLESIFVKNGPLHDGAVVITGNKILAASCVLPLTAVTKLPYKVGLRHRAAVGVTERMPVTAFIVSEENGKISYAHAGKLVRGVKEKDLLRLLIKYYQ